METPDPNLVKKEAIEKFDFSKYFLNALIVAIGYLFIMPWNIWASAAKRLALLRGQEGIIGNLSKTNSIFVI